MFLASCWWKQLNRAWWATVERLARNKKPKGRAMSRILVLRIVWGLLLLSLYLLFGVVTVGAQAQATAGQIIGTVKDPGGAVVPNASVIVSNPDIGFSQTYATNGEGEFRALALRPGNYMVEVMAPGFGKFTQTGYHVEVGSSLSASVNLAVEAVTEEVSVTAASVEVTETTMSTNINDVSIAQLPINGRRFQDFVLGTPSAQIDPARGQISLVGQ